MTSLKVGADTDAFCKTCDLSLAHVIVAMAGAKVARVQCKTCKTVHAFRGGPAKPRAPKATEPRKPGGALAGDYDKMMHGKDMSRAKRYDPKQRFGEGDVLDHKLFGFGLILRVLSDGKIDVLFKDGGKVLVHAR
jgi:hypothetical protein